MERKFGIELEIAGISQAIALRALTAAGIQVVRLEAVIAVWTFF